MLPPDSATWTLTPFDELSVSFENPATDAMGYNAVQGKLYCGIDRVQLQFKPKDRAFRKGETTTVEFDYGEVEKVEFVSRWFRPKVLIFSTRSPEKLAEFPGTKVGQVKLLVMPDSIDEAKKVAALIDYKQSEAFLAETESRIGRDSST